MIWQDIVISTANIVFVISLIPQVYYGFKEKVGPIKFQTSIPTSLGLCTMSYALWTLGLSVSAVVTFLSGLMWGVLFIQRLIYKKD
jgi:cellulose synthase/poly-beta-1,6-N-acetylglucosamine synthase-like glycosyltransferase